MVGCREGSDVTEAFRRLGPETHPQLPLKVAEVSLGSCDHYHKDPCGDFQDNS